MSRWRKLFGGSGGGGGGGGLDTMAKRQGADMVTLPFRTVLPNPTGTVDAAARKIAGLHYNI